MRWCFCLSIFKKTIIFCSLLSVWVNTLEVPSIEKKKKHTINSNKWSIVFAAWKYLYSQGLWSWSSSQSKRLTSHAMNFPCNSLFLFHSLLRIFPFSLSYIPITLCQLIELCLFYKCPLLGFRESMEKKGRVRNQTVQKNKGKY